MSELVEGGRLLNNVEVSYHVKRRDRSNSEIRKFRTAISKKSQDDVMNNIDNFQELIAEKENMDKKFIRVHGYKEFI